MNALTMRLARAGDGLVRHVPTALTAAPAKRTRKPRPAPDPIRTNGDTAAEELRLLVERAETITEEIKGAQDDLADVIAEARGRGYDPKAIRKILEIRRKAKEQHLEEQAILETYCVALGML